MYRLFVCNARRVLPVIQQTIFMLASQNKTPIYNIESLLRQDELRLIKSDLHINQEFDENTSNVAIVFPNSYPDAFVYLENLLQITSSKRATFITLHFYDPLGLLYLQKTLQQANPNTHEVQVLSFYCLRFKLLPLVSFCTAIAKYLGASTRWHTNVIQHVAQLFRETHSAELTFLWETARKRTLTNLVVVVAQTEGICRLRQSQLCWYKNHLF